ncbi:MAG TPA: hypothetical protein DCX25_01890 [Candidatus Pacebacteria bacterium]|nr:MAG: hypothetical protein UX00_C0002G0044 [Microgenomates group bacterium GW2011_GWB1_45_17]KKU23120.1 MAG: hypothetical protein UX35_C0010G0038 [Microgenomates group bacterium GW2011_GWA1_46_15]KKU23783.1 MAG: hypothetical protein UX36_C0003G0083 [Microgenomates group bacterium GW2011_GWC1_46_15]HAV15057.1 hypothetical protein [Candidatus Paceibacterota bacterium]HCR11686.1 hypothetical protein [Candidatus Paceibacterota bacterium]
MKLSELLKKKIPTILGLVFLGGGLVVGLLVLGQGTGGFLPKASPETTPKQLRITNITDSAFTVSFLTDTAVPGYVKYGTDQGQLKTQVSDDRDQLTGAVGQFTTHHITLRNLSPATKYFFTIGTASRTVYTDGGNPYSTTTAPRATGTPDALTVYGSVLTRAATPAQDSIVYVSVDGASPLSSLVKSSAGWAIPLSTARATDLKSFAPITTQSTLNIFVQGKDAAQTSRVTALVKDAQPVAAITLGQSQDLTQGAGTQTTTGATGDTSQFSASQLNSATESTTSGGTNGSSNTIQFLNPSQNGEEVNTTKPEIQGKAPASTTLIIKVESDPVYTGTVQTDAQGNWTYTPPANLTPGEHTVTVSYTDAGGVLRSEKRTFLVLASGSSSLPALTSTPSATPLPRVSTPATGSGIPRAGSTGQTFALLFAGLFFILGGALYWQKSLAYMAADERTMQSVSLDDNNQEPYAER